MSEPDYNGWISTFTNKKFYLFKPTIDMIDILDIAHALSMICRFGGHTKHFYSVAQHSIVVSQICDKQYALEGLLHDATEAFVGDMVRPLKQRMPEYIKVEDNLHDVINQKFNLNHSIECKTNIKEADNMALITEKRDLKDHELWDYLVDVKPMSAKLKPWSPARAEKEFLKLFYKLTKK